MVFLGGRQAGFTVLASSWSFAVGPSCPPFYVVIQVKVKCLGFVRLGFVLRPAQSPFTDTGTVHITHNLYK